MSGNNTHPHYGSAHHTSHHHHHSHHHARHTIICKFYSQNGHCRWGDRCNFSHNLTASTAQQQSSRSLSHHHQQAASLKKVTSNAPLERMHMNGGSSTARGTPSSLSSSHHSQDIVLSPTSSQSTSPSSQSSTFNTSPHVALRPLCPSLNIVKANFNRSSLNLLSTKPLLHIVVLYAGDINVRRYVAQLIPKFLHSRIHCFLQMNTPVSAENEDLVIENDLSLDDLQRTNCSIIKPEHLLQIITGSTADFLVVIGDRNMKHKTCQSKRNGKLIPAEIDEEVKRICDEWSQKKLKSPLDQIVASGVVGAKKDDVLKVFQWITNVRHIKTRAKKLQSDIKELTTWYTSLSDSPETTLLMNQERLKELTKLQNVAIRLHREVHSAQQVTQSIPTDDEHPADQKDGLDLTFITDYADYQVGVSHMLKSQLLEVSNAVLRKIENMCKDLAVFPQEGPLWKAYHEEYQRESRNTTEQHHHQKHFDRPALRYWNNDHISQRSRSSSNVSHRTVDSELPQQKSVSSTPIQIPGSQSKNGSKTIGNSQKPVSAWQSSSVTSSVIGTGGTQPSSYSGAVTSSLSSTPHSTQAEIGDQSSMHTDDVSSILSSKSSSADPFQRELSSSFSSSFMDSTGPLHGAAPSLSSALSNQMSNLNLYGATGGNSNSQHGPSGQLSSTNTSSFSSPSGSPPIFDSTWQGGLSSGFDHHHKTQHHHSLLGSSVLQSSNFGGDQHGGTTSFLNQRSSTTSSMWSAPPNGASSSSGHSNANVSRFADTSSSNGAPGLFSDLTLDAPGTRSRTNSNGFLPSPFMSPTGSSSTGAPSFQAPQLLGQQTSGAPSTQQGLMGTWSVPPFQQQTSQPQQQRPNLQNSTQWSNLHWNSTASNRNPF